MFKCTLVLAISLSSAFLHNPISEVSAANSVTFYLPYGSNLTDVVATRTGRIYEADYKAAGLTYMTDADYHPAASYASPNNMRGAIDFLIRYQPVYASATGTVKEVSDCHIYIDHGNGLVSFYEHLQKMNVKVGDVVNPTSIIGISGNGCNSEGAHLHFAVFLNGKEVKVSFADASVQATGGYVRPSHMSGNPRYVYVADTKKASGTTPIPTLPTTFINGTSRLYQDQNWNRVNLTICADNLAGNTVYVDFRRSGKEFTVPPKIATSRCVTFYDMDGAGPMNHTTYFSRAALNQKPDTGWPAPGCASVTGKKGLCDSITRK